MITFHLTPSTCHLTFSLKSYRFFYKMLLFSLSVAIIIVCLFVVVCFNYGYNVTVYHLVIIHLCNQNVVYICIVFLY